MVKRPVLRSHMAALGVVLAVAASVFAPVATTSASAPADCQFVLGFKTLRDMAPNVVGTCTGNQLYAANGDAVQMTTTGMLVWRKADNFTAFTDGFHTWVNGPYGVQERLNSERFAWEAPAPNASISPAVYTGVQPAESQASLDAMGNDLYKMLNADRQSNGVGTVVLNSELSALATQRAQGLLKTGGALSHYDPSGKLVLRQIMDQNKIPYVTAGENLAENNYDVSDTVDVANTGLMHSPTHRANILNPNYQQVGIGVAGPSPSGQYYYVQLFLQT
ncbi:MAG TPA: CAP domain-containing protein [Chloroflexota bacterium]|nr:CAP domain-containing protein [Chloroflexota bacterium]